MTEEDKAAPEVQILCTNQTAMDLKLKESGWTRTGMKVLSTEGFLAQEQPNGDVWIYHIKRRRNLAGLPMAPEEEGYIVIKQGKRDELAGFLRIGD